ncbi:hypothetical protein BWQ96_10279 [Gracilariopsis chorda]|uniref:Uncharacterized protein n=1 Tax=Gracilariopsis chorda TaxID=448386 RepID=A0A2V3ID80_9FLOR|nr:hypothetical protein BWQ96_10279 [Gracilariopsis chorda]|eukprot:PXF40011.1 hypothetical protein BWQ96_10279 [Gracilariopsis chorda]
MCSLISSLMAIAAPFNGLAGLAGFCEAGVLEPSSSFGRRFGGMDAGRNGIDVKNGGGGGAPPLDVAPGNFGGDGVGRTGADEPDLVAGGGGGGGRGPPPPEVLPDGSGGGVGAASTPDGAERNGGLGVLGAAGRARIVRNGMVPVMLRSGCIRREREERLFCQGATSVAAK